MKFGRRPATFALAYQHSSHDYLRNLKDLILFPDDFQKVLKKKNLPTILGHAAEPGCHFISFRRMVFFLFPNFKVSSGVAISVGHGQDLDDLHFTDEEK